jgi:hypothetical protein
MALPEKTAEDILLFDDRPFFLVDVPTWGCSVWVRELDVAESCKIRASSKDSDGNLLADDFAVKTVLEGAYKKAADGSFSKMFSPKDYERLKTKGNGVAVVAAAISNGKKNEVTKS